MSINKPHIPYTYQDYKSLPEWPDRRYELMDGELHVVPSPTTIHQFIAQNIEFLLVQHVRATGCGRVLHAPVDVVLGEGSGRSVVQPDILFVGTARERIIAEAEVAGAPDLVVEIISPGTEERDRGHKKTLYARSGVREYWIVDPKAKSVEVYRLTENGYGAPVPHGLGDELVPAVVPALRVAVDEVFRLP